MLRLVLDTDVMVAAFDSPTGASRRLLLAILDGKARLVLSTPLMLEYETVLTRPEVLAMTGLSVGEVIEILDELAGSCVPVAFEYRWRPMAADPDDDLVVETAINGAADALVTFNIRDMIAVRRFGVAVERPGVILRRLDRWAGA